MTSTSDPVDFPEMLAYIAEARALPPPNATQIAEMKRVLRSHTRTAIRAGVNHFLTEDTNVVTRLPLPAELLPYIQREARRIQAEARTAQPEAVCPSCDDTGWLEEQRDTVTRCRCKSGLRLVES